MLIVKYLLKLLKALGSEAEPWQLASGFILGMIIGLTPLVSLHNLFLFIFILILKVNMGMALLAFTLFSGIAWLADPFFDSFGYAILTMEAMQGLWTSIYNQPVIALTNFYNTVVMGSIVSSLLLAIPMYPALLKFIDLYRKHIHERIQNLKIIKVMKGSKLYSLYKKVNQFRGS